MPATVTSCRNGPWTFGKTVLIPAGLVERVDRDDECVYLTQTKEEISAAPEFDRSRYREADYRDMFASYYSGDRARYD